MVCFVGGFGWIKRNGKVGGLVGRERYDLGLYL